MKNAIKGSLAILAMVVSLSARAEMAAFTHANFNSMASASLGFGEAEDMFAMQKSDKLTLTSPLGYWALPDQSQNGFNFSMRLKITQTTVTAANRCAYNGQVAYVSATAPVVLTDKTMQVVGNAHNTVNVGGLNCDVNLSAGAPANYTINNGVMSLEGTPITASKLRDL